jgi:hypothetical protein
MATTWTANSYLILVLRRSGTDPQSCELGQLNEARLWGEVEDVSLRLFTLTLGWPYEVTRNIIEHIRSALQSEERRLYQPVTFVYGRKPGRA